MKVTLPSIFVTMIYKIPAVVVTIVWLACNSNDQHSAIERNNGYETVLNSKEDSLFHEIMQGHDKGMAKMGKLSGYQKRVQQAIDSLQKLTGKSKKQNNRHIKSLYSLKHELNEADSSMNVWMEGFKIDTALNETPERMKYLESEKNKIQQVNDLIFYCLQKADSLFKKN